MRKTLKEEIEKRNLDEEKKERVLTIRYYTDKAGNKRRLKYLIAGPYVKWHPGISASFTTWWQDLDNGDEIRIPNNAWFELKIEYKDIEYFTT